MAFKTNEGAGNNTNTGNGNGGNNDSWKAQGFLNIYLPTQDGKKRKLGSIPLKESKQSEKELLNWLNEDATRVKHIISLMIIEYQAAEQAAGSGFALPV